MLIGLMSIPARAEAFTDEIEGISLVRGLHIYSQVVAIK
jgi:hypothetical protein